MCGTRVSESAGVGRDAHPQPVLEPDLLNREIEPQEFQLAPQAALPALHVVEREAQQVAEPRDHRFGLRRLLLLDRAR